jgi:hypothetical protein
MDEFAQSREDDDLFADEFEPIPEPAVGEDVQSSTRGNLIPSSATGRGGAGGDSASTANNKPSSGPAGRRGGRGGGSREDRRGGRGGRTTGGLASSRYAPQSKPEKGEEKSDTPNAEPSTLPPPPQEASTATDTSTTIAPATSNTSANVDTTVDSTVEPTQSPPPFEPQAPQQSIRPTAVRGDRHLTGGPAHIKLTEAELTEKMEKMKILNAQKAERFRLSEEDSAAYARKEKEMAKKRVEEQKNARAMDMERAKNRQRKLAAQGGREWDSEKQESDIVDGRGRGRSSEYVRGGHGGVIRGGLAGSRFAQADSEDGGGQSVRGRGGFEIKGRGNRGSRGGSRGGKSISAPVSTPDDFPELPTAPKPSTDETKIAAQQVKLPIDKPAGDWAEEMATPLEEKEIDL